MTQLERDIPPQFAVPLMRSELTSLGKFTLNWGQIDHWLLIVVAKLAAIDFGAGLMFMEGLTTGPRVNLLRKSSIRIEDVSIRKKSKAFCEDMGSLIDKRNAVMHGIWGWHFGVKGKLTPACYYSKNPSKPVYATELQKLANSAARQSYVIHEIACHVLKTALPTENNPNPKYIFSEDEPPDWLKSTLSESL